jgi:hypothetical protein
MVTVATVLMRGLTNLFYSTWLIVPDFASLHLLCNLFPFVTLSLPTPEQKRGGHDQSLIEVTN